MAKIRIAITAALLLSLLTFGAGRVNADPPRVIIEPPVFVPEADFHHENGYYRTNEGHYYHYDRDRNGWHYGRNHEEGVRWEHDHRHR